MSGIVTKMGGVGSLRISKKSLVSELTCSGEKPGSDVRLGSAAAAFGLVSPLNSLEVHGCFVGWL